MNTIQGQAPGDGSILKKDSALLVLPVTNILPDHNESNKKFKFPDRSRLAKMVFFSCEKCSGPLIPISSCEVCQKTSFRKCLKCGWKIISGSHDSCECLIALRTEKKMIPKKDGG
jgi:hypothetical protein